MAKHLMPKPGCTASMDVKFTLSPKREALTSLATGLRSLIDRAKKDQVPTHVIEKAIEKAKGGAGENFELARYEGYGPGNYGNY